MYVHLPEIALVLPQDTELPSLVLYLYKYCSGIRYSDDIRNCGTDAMHPTNSGSHDSVLCTCTVYQYRGKC